MRATQQELRLNQLVFGAKMALFALIVALLNFVVGFALAIALGNMASGEKLSFVKKRVPTKTDEDTKPQEPPKPQPTASSKSLEVVSMEDIPELWHDAVEQSPIPPISLAEAAVFFIQVRADALTDKLPPQEEQSRQIDMLVGADPYREVVGNIEEFTRDWINDLEETKSHLEKSTEAEQVSVSTESVIQMIDEHLEHVQATVNAAKSLDFEDDVFESGHQLIDCICDLAKSLHQIRDESAVMFAEKLYMSDRTDPGESETSSTQVDLAGLIGLLNQWQKTEPANGETRHVALLDVDQFGSVNTQWGIACGDRVLCGFGELLVEMQASMPNLLSFARYRGASFMLCFVQSDDDAIDKSVQDIQKAVEEHNFGSEERELKLATGLSLCEFVPDEPFKTIIEKLGTRT